jgi:hypothetical protein
LGVALKILKGNAAIFPQNDPQSVDLVGFAASPTSQDDRSDNVGRARRTECFLALTVSSPWIRGEGMGSLRQFGQSGKAIAVQ